MEKGNTFVRIYAGDRSVEIENEFNGTKVDQFNFKASDEFTGVANWIRCSIDVKAFSLSTSINSLYNYFQCKRGVFSAAAAASYLIRRLELMKTIMESVSILG